jgi:DNA invertase Pin-like site-specific DNA recombinase
MRVPRKAAIYARISSDQEGTGLGVARQLEDCRRLAEQLGWKVAEEYVDNDVSAYSGRKRRPAYERMLADLASGDRDGLLCYHQDRLTRRPIENERLVEVMSAAGARLQFVSGGDVDLANGDALLMLRIQAAVAAKESADKSRRVKRKLRANAEEGKPHGGSHRPFGFNDDKRTHRPDEADAIRTMVSRYLAGESLRSLVAWAEDTGLRTVEGKPWQITTIKTVICSPRIAGLRQHQGEAIGPADWDPIITPAQREQVLARVAARATSGKRSPRRYLLSGLLRCGKCDSRLKSAAKYTGPNTTLTRRYHCKSGPSFGGCGKLTIVAAPLEELITDAVLFRLDTPDMADLLAGRVAANTEAAAVAEALAADEAQLEDLARVFADKQIGMREWLAARTPIEARIKDAQRKLAASTDSDVIAGWIGNGEQLRNQWAGLNLDRQHAIVAAVLDHAVIGPGVRGARTLDPDRVSPVWRV